MTSIRKTAAGDLLVELTKSSKSVTAADILKDRIAAFIPDASVKCLRQTSEVEIVELDKMISKEEVHATLLKITNADGSAVKVTDIWIY